MLETTTKVQPAEPEQPKTQAQAVPNKGTLYFNVPLAPLTSWRIGGNASRLYRPISINDLRDFLASLAEHESLFFLGLGSNILIRDGGISGVVIHLHKGLNNIKLADDSVDTVMVEAGVTCAKIAKFAVKHSLVGAEFFAGIPGTMGGALAMNAGAFGGDTWQNVAKVALLDRYGNLQYKTPEDFNISYRQVTHKDSTDQDNLFVAAWLKFAKGDTSLVAEQVKSLLKKRNNSQPIGTLNCGSVFKNPKPHHAAWLIESAGLKGLTVGDAVVSAKHANFIINQGSASAADVENLIKFVQQKVIEQHNIKLELEVRIVGEY